MSFPRYPEYKDSGVEWLGEVPAHWKIIQSRRLFRERKDRATDGDRQLTASQKHGVIYQDDFMSIEGHKVMQVIHGADILKRAEPNDFVISMRSFQGGIEWCGLAGSISSAYVMLIPENSVVPGYFRYLFKSSRYVQALQSTTNLVRDGQALRFANFVLVDLPVVPEQEQLCIAMFLDRETAKIDALVAEQEKLIALLQEKRQAVISHAVTKGLDPNVPMKDSGVEWLGEVPEHWEVKRVKHVKADEPNAFVDGPFGSNLKSEHYVEDGDVYVIESSFATQGVLEISNLKTITHEHFKSIARSETKAGDIIIAKIGAQFGKCSILPMLDKPAVVSGNSLKLSVNEDVMNVELVCWQLVNLKQQGAIDLIVNLTAQPALSLGSMNELPILVPPKTEQIQIVGALALKLEQYDSLVSEARTAITLLQERRTALISAAVTGQIDVRGLATRGDAAQALAILDRLDRQDQDAAAH